MNENVPLNFLRAANKVIQAIWSLPEVALLDLKKLRITAAERNISIFSLLKEALHKGASEIPNVAFFELDQLEDLTQRIHQKMALVESQPEALYAGSTLHIVRDIVRSFYYISLVIPDLLTHPAYHDFLQRAIQLSSYTKEHFDSNHPFVLLIDKYCIQRTVSS